VGRSARAGAYNNQAILPPSLHYVGSSVPNTSGVRRPLLREVSLGWVNMSERIQQPLIATMVVVFLELSALFIFAAMAFSYFSRLSLVDKINLLKAVSLFYIIWGTLVDFYRNKRREASSLRGFDLFFKAVILLLVILFFVGVVMGVNSKATLAHYPPDLRAQIQLLPRSFDFGQVALEYSKYFSMFMVLAFCVANVMIHRNIAYSDEMRIEAQEFLLFCDFPIFAALFVSSLFFFAFGSHETIEQSAASAGATAMLIFVNSVLSRAIDMKRAPPYKWVDTLLRRF
jgi:hypothetical protein